ncbi:carbohydrate binding domain-containing protein [Marinoscillum furvescens]|nr:carbohydrate binding domain-containing protein [Marinoscillum furvescens]
MKNLFQLFVCLMVSVLHAQESNLMDYNGGFEAGNPGWSSVVDDWHYKRWGDSKMNVSRTEAAARSGAYGVSINIETTGGKEVAGMAGLRREVTGIKTQTTYELRFYVKAEQAGSQEILLSIGDYLTDPVVSIADTAIVYTGGDWEEIVFPFATDVAGTDYSQIRFDIDFRANVGTYFVDDFELVQTVYKAPQEITFADLANRQVGDADFELTATASSGLQVSYASSNTNVATINGNVVSIVGDGSTQITATQEGDEEYAPADPVVRTLIVTDPNKEDQQITFPAITEKAYGDPAFELLATASSGLTVEYVALTENISIEGSEVTITGIGEASISAHQAGDANYNAATPVEQTFSISKAHQQIELGQIPDQGVKSRPIRVEASASSGLELALAVSGPASLDGNQLILDGIEGTVTVTATQAGNEFYHEASASTSFEVVACGTAGVTCFEGVFYVAKSGSDDNPGTAEAPFLTIQRAADEMLPGEKCVIAEGTYREYVKPVSDGVTFEAVEGDEVVISAFESYNDWTVHTGKIYKTEIAFSLGEQNSVMFDDQLMNLARWPNKESFDPFDLQSAKGFGSASTIENSSIPAQGFENGGVVWFLGKSRWTSWRRKITSNPAGSVGFQTLPDDWFFNGSHSPSNGGEFILYNSFEALDTDGEWYVNGATNELFFQAPGGVSLEGKSVEVRQRVSCFNLQDRDQVTIRGLKLNGGNLRMEGATNCLIEDVEILYGTHSLSAEGSAANQSFRPGIASIQLSGSSQNNVINRCNIQFGSGSGVIVNGVGNVVQNSYVGNFDYSGSYAAPIRLSGANKILHNEIFNAGRDLINGGGKGAEIAYNDLYAANLINDDCGAIYMCCGNYGNTRIHHNWIHDISSRNEHFNSYKATGIYLDNSTVDVVVDHNVLWNLEWAGIQINWAGTNLQIYNNTVWSMDSPESSTMGRWVNGYEFTNVPVYNTLANNSEYHATDLKNNVTLELDADPFEDFANRNFMPKEGIMAVDAGMSIDGITDNSSGEAPDAGAYERGQPYWVPGPDWQPSGAAPSDDCNGDAGGSAYIDRCGRCVGGNTGLDPAEGECPKEEEPVLNSNTQGSLMVYPNPVKSKLWISGAISGKFVLRDLTGKALKSGAIDSSLDFSDQSSGIYLLDLEIQAGTLQYKIIKE